MLSQLSTEVLCLIMRLLDDSDLLRLASTCSLLRIEFDSPLYSSEFKLWWAARNNKLTIVERMVKTDNGRRVIRTLCAGFTPEEHVGRLFRKRNSWFEDDTLLTWAVRVGASEFLSYLFESGCRIDIDVPDLNYITPLVPAIRQGDFEVVRELLSLGAHPSLCIAGHSPIYFATQAGRCDILTLLLAYGAKIPPPTNTILSEVARLGHTDIVRLLLERGEDVNEEDFYTRRTALYSALENSNYLTARLLLEVGASIHPEVLSASASRWDVGAVTLLLGYGADIQGQDESPLSSAILTYCTTLNHIRSSIYYGSPGSGLETDYLSGKLRMGRETVHILLKHGAEIGSTALAAVLQATDEFIEKFPQSILLEQIIATARVFVQLLLQHDARVDISYWGWSCADYAKRIGDEEILKRVDTPNATRTLTKSRKPRKNKISQVLEH